MCVSSAPLSPEQREPGTALSHVDGQAEKRRPDMGLSYSQRLQESRAFQEAFDHGTHFVGRAMVMWLRKSDDATLRLGVVASKRTFRRAVERSRAKRLLREAYRLNRFRFSGGQDVILVARRAILDMPRQGVERDLLTLAEKAGMVGKKIC